MVIVDRALGGSRARKLRAVLPDRLLKGENLALTEVMNLVSIAAMAPARIRADMSMECSRLHVYSAQGQCRLRRSPGVLSQTQQQLRSDADQHSSLSLVRLSSDYLTTSTAWSTSVSTPWLTSMLS